MTPEQLDALEASRRRWKVEAQRLVREREAFHDALREITYLGCPASDIAQAAIDVVCAPVEASAVIDRREHCERCCGVNVVGFSVPDDVWRAATADTRWSASVLCVTCFDALATDRGVEWTFDVRWWPVSGLTAADRPLTSTENAPDGEVGR